MKHVYVNPVVCSTELRQFPVPELNEPEKLKEALRERDLDVKLGKLLKGGFVSQVYEAELNGGKVVIKHTENCIPFDPTEIFISKEGHNTDTYVLKLLQKSEKVRVPKVLHHFPEITTTIMEDLTESGFTLMSDRIIQDRVLPDSAETIGKSLAYLIQKSRGWQAFSTNLSAHQNIYERGLELRLSYPNTQKQYLALEREFTENNQYWAWLDGHPKNIFVDKFGNVAFIDFGSSSFADQRFVLPNFLAHIVIYSLAGCFSVEEAKKYISTCFEEYNRIEPIDEQLFCQYLAMEVFHRANGKWLGGIESLEQKIALHRFGLTVFDKHIFELGSLLECLNGQ